MAYIVAGIHFRRRGAQRFGVAGLLWATQYVSALNIGPMPVLGVMANATFCVVVVRTLIDFVTNGRCTSVARFVRIGVLAIPLTSVALLLCSRPEWAGYSNDAWWPTLFANREVLQLSIWLCAAIDASLLIGLALSLVSRLRTLKWLDRVSVLPILVCTVGVLLVMATLEGQQVEARDVVASYFAAPPVALSIFALLIPIGLVLVDIRRITATASIVQRLSTNLRNSEAFPEALQQAFRDESMMYPLASTEYLALQRDVIAVASVSCELAGQNVSLRRHLTYEPPDIELVRLAERERLAELIDQTLAPRLQSALTLLESGEAESLHDELTGVVDEVRNLKRN
jgi:hypothetical protein